MELDKLVMLQIHYQSNTYDSNFNVDADIAHRLGIVEVWFDHYSGYIADVNFIDGTALAPTSFGETKNGVWIPKDTSGLTYGNNGYRLQFTK